MVKEEKIWIRATAEMKVSFEFIAAGEMEFGFGLVAKTTVNNYHCGSVLYEPVWMATKIHPKNFLVMTNKLVYVWVGCPFLACQWQNDRSCLFFLLILANSWANK